MTLFTNTILDINIIMGSWIKSINNQLWIVNHSYLIFYWFSMFWLRHQRSIHQYHVPLSLSLSLIFCFGFVRSTKHRVKRRENISPTNKIFVCWEDILSFFDSVFCTSDEAKMFCIDFSHSTRRFLPCTTTTSVVVAVSPFWLVMF